MPSTTRWVLSLLFARPTPALEFLHVSSSRRLLSPTGRIRHDTRPLNGLLPASPRLHTAYLGVDCFFPFQTAATTVVDLAVDSHMTHVKLWDMLAHTPNVKTLRLALTCGKNGGDVPVVDALVAAPIVLPSLEHLEVRSHLLCKTLKLAALYTRTPNLSRLSLPHSMIWKTKSLRRVKGFISVNGNALTELTVREDMPARSYDNPATLGVADFWVSLKTETPLLAPGLRKLFMLGIVDIPGPQGLQAYNDFKAARNDAALNDEERLEVTEQWDHPPEVTRKPIVRGQPGKGLLAGYRPRH